VNRTSTLLAPWHALRVRFLGERHPLAARIQVTRRCSSRCSYCNLAQESGDQMTSEQIVAVMSQLAELGCLRISLSGGEPMLRKDIGRIVDACSELGMAPEMNSSGAGFAARVHEVRGLRLLKLSLDGPEEIHDAVRGRKGSYREVMEAIEAARSVGIRTVLVSTITRHNVRDLDHVLRVARERSTLAAFQPMKPYYKGSLDVEEHLPDRGDMRRAIDRLRSARPDELRNSPAGLDHLAHWPQYGSLRCWAGRIFCIVGSDGTLYPCDRTHVRERLPNCLELGMRRALERLPDPECDGCGFCGALELNFAMALDWRVASTIARLVR
jgi:MoaA/NifB/PqqE/SkfB family radical SAM enzyme